MAEPLSIATTAIGLAATITKIVGLLNKWIGNVKTIEKVLQMFFKEIQILGLSLNEVYFILHDPQILANLSLFPEDIVKRHLRDLEASLLGCAESLKKIESKLQGAETGPFSSTFLKSLVSSWKIESYTRELEALRHLVDKFVQSIQLRMSMMQSLQTTALSSDMVEVLAHIRDGQRQMSESVSELKEDLNQIRLGFPSSNTLCLPGEDMLHVLATNTETLVESAAKDYNDRADSEIDEVMSKMTLSDANTTIENWRNGVVSQELRPHGENETEILDAQFKSGFAAHALGLLKQQKYGEAELFYQEFFKQDRNNEEFGITERAKLHLALCYIAQALLRRADERLEQVHLKELPQALALEARAVSIILIYLRGDLPAARALTDGLLRDGEELCKTPSHVDVRSTAWLLADILDASRDGKAASHLREAYQPQPTSIRYQILGAAEESIRNSIMSDGVDLASLESRQIALLIAQNKHSPEQVAYLKKLEPNIGIGIDDPYSRLAFAVKQGRGDIVTSIVESEAISKVGDQDDDAFEEHWEVLWFFTPSRYEAGVKALLRSGVLLPVDVMLPNHLNSALRESTAWQIRGGVLQLILDLSKTPNFVRLPGETALIFAAERQYQFLLPILLAAGADVNLGTSYKEKGLVHGVSWTMYRTALMTTVNLLEERTDIVQMLIDAGAYLDLQDEDGKTALMLAEWRRHNNIIDLLLGMGANVNLRDRLDGSTVLHQAALRGRDEAVRIYLSSGAAKEKKCGLGRTALGYAAAYNRHSTIKILLEAGASPNPEKDRLGYTPLISALYTADRAMVNLLVDAGADVTVKTGQGESVQDLIHTLTVIGRSYRSACGMFLQADSEMSLAFLQAFEEKQEMREDEKVAEMINRTREVNEEAELPEVKQSNNAERSEKKRPLPSNAETLLGAGWILTKLNQWIWKTDDFRVELEDQSASEALER